MCQRDLDSLGMGRKEFTEFNREEIKCSASGRDEQQDGRGSGTRERQEGIGGSGGH